MRYAHALTLLDSLLYRPHRLPSQNKSIAPVELEFLFLASCTFAEVRGCNCFTPETRRETRSSSPPDRGRTSTRLSLSIVNSCRSMRAASYCVFVSFVVLSTRGPHLQFHTPVALMAIIRKILLHIRMHRTGINYHAASFIIFTIVSSTS